MFSGADPREASIDSFQTDEGEVDNNNQIESTTKSEVENVVERKSQDTKNEELAKKSEEKKKIKHHPVKSTIQTGPGAARGLAKPSSLRPGAVPNDQSKRTDKTVET